MQNWKISSQYVLAKFKVQSSHQPPIWLSRWFFTISVSLFNFFLISKWFTPDRLTKGTLIPSTLSLPSHGWNEYAITYNLGGQYWGDSLSSLALFDFVLFNWLNRLKTLFVLKRGSSLDQFTYANWRGIDRDSYIEAANYNDEAVAEE